MKPRLRQIVNQSSGFDEKKEMSQGRTSATLESRTRVSPTTKFGRVLPSLAVAARIAEALDCTIDESSKIILKQRLTDVKDLLKLPTSLVNATTTRLSF